MIVIFPKDVLENNEFNNNKPKGVFQNKDQGFQIKLPRLLLFFPLIKRKIVINLPCTISTLLRIYYI